MKKNDHLIWIDLEMTGLDPSINRIIEIATIVTDSNLQVIAEGPVFAIHQAEDELLRMDAWNTRQHHLSGLVPRVQNSNVTEQIAERLTLSFLKQHVAPKTSPICGNSVHQDMRFLLQYMPQLADFFHYRQLDVSTLKELARRWRPDLLSGFHKESKHLALNDIKDSIAELAYYRQHFIMDHPPHAQS